MEHSRPRKRAGLKRKRETRRFSTTGGGEKKGGRFFSGQWWVAFAPAERERIDTGKKQGFVGR